MSEEQRPTPEHATAELEIALNRMEASLVISPPKDGGADLTLTQFQNILKSRGITSGIDLARLQELDKYPVYNKPVVIAHGQDSIPGDDAKMVFHFREERDFKPKENPDGSVDFKSLGLIEEVKKGALLCEKRPPTAGKMGWDIFGNEIAAKPGKDRPLPGGKNTVFSEDKLKLFAAIDGQVDLINGKVHVFDTYTINGDISPATGNIEFVGNVVVTGGVRAGFSVQATGNIDIGGIVEAAQITAGGSLIIRGGVNGADTGVLEAEGNLSCKFMQNVRVTVGGDIETTYILNSQVSCGGSINLSGKGLIMGGSVVARGTVSAAFLGSASSTADTIIEVGSSPKLLKRAKELPGEIENCEKTIRDLEVLSKTLLRVKAAGKLTPDKAAALAKSLQGLSMAKSNRDSLEAEYEIVQAQVADVSQSMVKVSRTAYVGVKIIIGNEQFPLKSEYNFSTFRRTRDGIVASSLR